MHHVLQENHRGETVQILMTLLYRAMRTLTLRSWPAYRCDKTETKLKENRMR